VPEGRKITTKPFRKPGRDPQELNGLNAWRTTRNPAKEFPQIIGEAKRAMNIDDTHKRFSRDALALEVVRERCDINMSLVDLPGLWSTCSSEQTVEDLENVENMILDYILQERVVILAIVAGDLDIHNQKVLQFLESRLPNQDNILGIIAKPDKLLVDRPGLLGKYINIVNNMLEGNQLGFGWLMLKNRSQQQQHFSQEQRIAQEAEFFAGEKWKDVPKDRMGVGALEQRLNQIIDDQSAAAVNPVLDDIDKPITATKQDLTALEAARNSCDIDKVLNKIASLVCMAAGRTYTHSFFGDSGSGEGTTHAAHKRLNHAIRDIHTGLLRKLTDGGHSYSILESPVGQPLVSSFRSTASVPATRAQLSIELENLIGYDEQLHLFGDLSRYHASALLRTKAQNWSAIVLECHGQLIAAITSCVKAVVAEMCPAESCLQTMQNRLVEVALKAVDLPWKELKGAATAWISRTEEIIFPVEVDEWAKAEVEEYYGRASSAILDRHSGGDVVSRESLNQPLRPVVTLHGLKASIIITCVERYYQVSFPWSHDNAKCL
jgi:Dynamin family/Dynamin central region